MNADATVLRRGAPAGAAGDGQSTWVIALQQILFALMPVVVLVWRLAVVFGRPHSFVAVDFHQAYYAAGYRLLHGGDPYDWTNRQIDVGVAFVYPAFSAVFFAPFALLAEEIGGVLVTLICIALTPLTLWVLRVRDWRIYGASMLWLPVFIAWQTANETILLVFMTALVWRHRGNPIVAGVLTAAAISLKPFVWPLALWLLATRRWRASVYGLVVGLVINAVSWSVVGFDKIGVYLRDSGIDTSHNWRAGYSVAAALGHLGLGRAVGDTATVLVCVALAAAIVYVAFIKHRERQALTLTIILTLAASPLVWSHYFAVLLIPMALERPRMSWLWTLPVLMWDCPPVSDVHAWQEAVAWLVAGTMLIAVARTARE